MALTMDGPGVKGSGQATAGDEGVLIGISPAVARVGRLAAASLAPTVLGRHPAPSGSCIPSSQHLASSRSPDHSLRRNAFILLNLSNENCRLKLSTTCCRAAGLAMRSAVASPCR